MMPTDSTAFSPLLSDPVELIKFIGALISILAALVAILIGVMTKLWPLWKVRRDRRSLDKRFGAQLYPKAAIENAVRFYIEPDCQSLDPGGAEEPKLVYGARQNLFAAVDQALYSTTQHRYVILLADSGMGKSTFLLNYYVRYLRRRRRNFNLELVPLNIPDADERIAKIEDKAQTVLFLDALDEDTLAIVDHAERLANLRALTLDFERVLITCRTQFFPKDEEIPRETGVVIVGPRDAGEQGQYYYHKLYLSPFTDDQVQAYLMKRYPFRQKRKREKALDIVKRIPQLSARPMLLARIDVLLQSDRETTFVFELYEEMVQGWLVREEGILEGIRKDFLREFSERLAVDLYINRKDRGSERIPKIMLAGLAAEWQIPLEDWQLSGRSLLNRDAEGNYKFAHRSIMEYLFVRRLIKGDRKCRNIELTDQMQSFIWEVIQKGATAGQPIGFDLDGVNLGRYQLRLRSKSLKSLTGKAVKSMLAEQGFYCAKHDWSKEWCNPRGQGIQHLYQSTNINLLKKPAK